jgi:ferritin-like metal-binding protein YciE
MADEGTLHDLFIDELRDVYHAEHQLVKALPKMAKAAKSRELRAAFSAHLKETKGQIKRLEEAFDSLGLRPRGKPCDGMAGIIKEGQEVMKEDFERQAMDAALIAAAQRVEHYEMAAYGSLVAWAKAMGHTKAARLLQQNLNEEGKADKKLTSIATRGVNINRKAAEIAHPDE